MSTLCPCKRHEAHASKRKRRRWVIHEEEDPELLAQEYTGTIKEYCDTVEPVRTGMFGEPFLVTVIDYDKEDAWACHPYSVLVSPSNAEEAEATMLNEIEEYYKNTEFYDVVTDMLPEDLVRIFLAEADFSVIRYFSEKTNCRSECRDFSLM